MPNKINVEPARNKKDADRIAEAIRKKGYKANIKKSGIYGKSRGFPYTVVQGRKRKR